MTAMVHSGAASRFGLLNCGEEQSKIPQRSAVSVGQAWK